MEGLHMWKLWKHIVANLWENRGASEGLMLGGGKMCFKDYFVEFLNFHY